MKTADLIQSSFEAHSIIAGHVYKLEGLSDAFDRVGNSLLAETLDLLASGLCEANDILRNNTNEMISIRAQETDQATHNLMAAALVSLSARG